jgi:hypothetical protein
MKNSTVSVSSRNRTGAVPADVRKSSEPFILPSRNNYRFVCDFSRKVVAGPSDLFHSSDKLPR